MAKTTDSTVKRYSTTVVHGEQERKDRPSGIGGWLLVLVIGLTVAGPLIGVAKFAGGFFAAELKYAFLIEDQEWTTYKSLSWATFAAFAIASVYGGFILVTRREWKTVSYVKAILWIIGPIASVVLSMAIPTYFFGIEALLNNSQVVGELVGSIIGVAVWTTYLKKSVRVRNTYSSDTRKKDEIVLQLEPNCHEFDKGRFSAESRHKQMKENTKRNHVVSATAKVTDETVPHEGEQPLCLEIEADSQDKDKSTQSAAPESAAYAQAWEEIETGAYDKAVWAQAFATCDGDTNRVKAKYLQVRVKNIQEKWEHSEKVERKRKAKAVELDRQKKAVVAFHEEILPLIREHQNKNYDRYIDAPLLTGRTRLGEAVFWGDRKLALQWLAKGANPFAKDGFSKQPDDVADANKNQDMQDLLITAQLWWKVRGSKIVRKKARHIGSTNELRLLEKEIQKSRKEIGIVEELTLDNYVAQDSTLVKQFWEAIGRNDPILVKQTLLHGTDPFAVGSFGKTALEIANQFNDSEEVTYALKRMQFYWQKKLKKHFDHQSDPAKNKETARYLLSEMYGIHTHVANNEKSTADDLLLSRAAEQGNSVLVRCLLVGFPIQFLRSELVANAQNAAREHAHTSVENILTEFSQETTA